jgi:hypothetical protein
MAVADIAAASFALISTIQVNLKWKWREEVRADIVDKSGQVSFFAEVTNSNALNYRQE